MNERLFWKATRPDLRTRNGYRWMPPGQSDRVPADPAGWLYPPEGFDGPCGLWVAKTFRGASLGGHGVGTVLIVSVPEDDVLAEDENKARIRGYTTWEVVDTHRLIRRFGAYSDLAGADLTWANIARANLTRANLTGVNLTGAYLAGANLTGADLTWANLPGANLTDVNLDGAYLAGANLTRANLTRANLPWAYLAWANLTGAYLAGANLDGAYLAGADLTGADLTDVNYTRSTRWPAGFDTTTIPTKGDDR